MKPQAYLVVGNCLGCGAPIFAPAELRDSGSGVRVECITEPRAIWSCGCMRNMPGMPALKGDDDA